MMWMEAGTAAPFAFSTASTSECRSADGECSSSVVGLMEILKPQREVPGRYFLSAVAAAGVLTRLKRNGKHLSPMLTKMLEKIANGEPNPPAKASQNRE